MFLFYQIQLSYKYVWFVCRYQVRFLFFGLLHLLEQVLHIGQQYALVQRPDGSVASVRVGNYLGLNDGRIVEITPTQINLIEIVPDSRAGFVEKPQSLVSPIS
mgnify:CR=1 FL=1